MKVIIKKINVWSFILCVSILLAACGNSTASTTTSEPSTSSNNATAESVATTKSFTDFKNNNVEVPTHPERIIYIGGDLGDLLALHVKPIGSSLQVIADQVVYSDLLEGIVDIGEPADMEKIADLNPDLILVDGGGLYDNIYESLTKIAPTVQLERKQTYDRLRTLGDILGKSDVAEQWITTYEKKAKQVVSQLKSHSGDTATVFLQLGKDMYVMGDKGFATTLYNILQFKPSIGVEKMIADKEDFAQISEEALSDYAGQWLFILNDGNTASDANTQKMLQSAIWQAIPAVKANHVYMLSSTWNFDDPITRERMLDELPKIMNK